MAAEGEVSARSAILPPDSFTAEENLCYWAYDVFLRTIEEGRGLRPEENAAYGFIYRITTVHDHGQPLTAQEKRLYDLYCQVIEVYETLHRGGQLFGEPRFEHLKGKGKEKEKDTTWKISKIDSCQRPPTWNDVPGIALPDKPLNAPRHRLGAPPGWPDYFDVDYVPPEAKKLTPQEKKEAKKREKEELEVAKKRLEEKRIWLEKEKQEDALREAAREQERIKQKELEAKRIEEAKRRRAQLAAPPPPGLPIVPKAKVATEEEKAAMDAKREEERIKEKQRKEQAKAFIGKIGPDGKPYEDERLKEKVNLSYQEIADPYQMQKFKLMLPRLALVKTLVLSQNGLSDLSDFSFPACELLVLNGNEFVSFEKMPKCPQLVRLDVSFNRIWCFKGLKKLSISALNCQDNPVTVEADYRERVVASSSPKLIELDDSALDRSKYKDYKFDKDLSNRNLDQSCILL